MVTDLLLNNGKDMPITDCEIIGFNFLWVQLLTMLKL